MVEDILPSQRLSTDSLKHHKLTTEIDVNNEWHVIAKSLAVAVSSAVEFLVM